jgi:hypothetical protein
MNKFSKKVIYWILARHAKKILKKYQPFVIGISGGSSAKFSKRAINQLLCDSFNQPVKKELRASDPKINALLTILGSTKTPTILTWPFLLIKSCFGRLDLEYPKYLVLEVDLAGQRDIDFYARIINFDLWVVSGGDTNLLPSLVKPGGKIIINIDKIKEKLPMGLDEGSIKVAVENEKVNYRGILLDEQDESKYRIVTRGQNILIKSKLVGSDYIYGGLIAFAVGQILGIQSLQIKKSLEILE